MKKQEPSETAVASYELTAAKNKNEISDRELNEMLSESESDTEKRVRSRRSHVVFRFFFRHFFWIFVCVMTFALCIYCSNLFFETQDKKTLGVMQSGTLDTVSIETQEQLTIYEKMNILVRSANVTDLNYDSTDKHTYGEIHDLFVSEITDFFQCMGLPFSVNGIYEMYIYKYLYMDRNDSGKSFTGWFTHIEYYGFTLDCILDYDTQKILGLCLSTDMSENNYHTTEADLEQLPDYNSYIAPLLTYQKDTYVGNTDQFATSDYMKAKEDLAMSDYTTLLRVYYEDDAIYSIGYGYEGKNGGYTHSETASSTNISIRSDETFDYNYYYFLSENATNENSSMTIDKFTDSFSFNRIELN